MANDFVYSLLEEKTDKCKIKQKKNNFCGIIYCEDGFNLTLIKFQP